MIVVLNASSSDARYVDTRNLYRWAWQQLRNPRSNRVPGVSANK